jgi:LytS/YehU family sensor histidine kinase
MLKFVVYGFVLGISYAVREGGRARAAQLRAARLETLATRARLSALQSQLNPHFLFNTLHSLSVLIRRDPELAEEALDRLGELLRYALDHGARDAVPLREEVAFVENYVAIEKIRLGERLRLVRDVDDRALSQWVPPFCLQPLVENAIRHGLTPRPAGGTVWITIRLQSGGLSLAVRDDGAGAADRGAGLGTGRGLGSLRQRVEAWEDGPGRLEVATSPGSGFCATVRLPVEATHAVPPPSRPAVAAMEPS